MIFETVIGLEVHVELATESKIFCSCTTKFGGAPNTHCCPICTGMPGTLPTLNKKVLEYAVTAGLALNCKIQKSNRFDRKNYFYPDLPKAYQISQLYMPFARDGSVEITTRSGVTKTIGIHEIHMEEDAGKLIHSETEGITFTDYNRCGVPLIEIVSEPDFRNAEEVIAYLEKIKSIFEYLGVSDCKMQEGSMRCDVNLSVREAGSKTLGTRTEMKNLNSFRGIERAIKFEAERQIKALEAGEKIVQETRRWDDLKGIGYAMRSKENAQDYRYFPEPDIPPIIISDDTINTVQASMPEFADAKAKRYTEQFGLSKADAVLVAGSKHLAELFEKTVELTGNPKEVRYWLVGQIFYLMNEKGILPEDLKLSPELFASFVKIAASDRINKQAGKIVFEAMFMSPEDFDIEGFIKENGLEQIDDTETIRAAVREVISNNPKTVEQFLSGQTKVVGFFVGQVMKETGGKAKPDTVNKLVNEELNKL